MRVLLADHEKKIAQHARNALREQSFTVDLFYRGDEALDAALSSSYDALVLDVLLPEFDGLSILRKLRAKKVMTPVMLVTGRDVSARIDSLMLGADDSLSKPFAVSELVARVIALSRRASSHGMSIKRLEDLTMNLITREVTREGRRIALATREFALLEYLFRVPGRVVSKEQVIENVWEHHAGANVVEVYIKRLRKKVDEGHDLKLIQTVRGAGYVLRNRQ